MIKVEEIFFRRGCPEGTGIKEKEGRMIMMTQTRTKMEELGEEVKEKEKQIKVRVGERR